MTSIHTLGELRAAGYRVRSVKDEMRANLLRAIANGEPTFTGIHGYYLKQSIEASGMDPENLPEGDLKTMDFASQVGGKVKAWRDIWGSGQGIGAVHEVLPAGDYVARLAEEYRQARAELHAKLR